MVELKIREEEVFPILFNVTEVCNRSGYSRVNTKKYYYRYTTQIYNIRKSTNITRTKHKSPRIKEKCTELATMDFKIKCMGTLPLRCKFSGWKVATNLKYKYSRLKTTHKIFHFIYIPFKINSNDIPNCFRIIIYCVVYFVVCFDIPVPKDY